jgi:hypothetical protein
MFVCFFVTKKVKKDKQQCFFVLKLTKRKRKLKKKNEYCQREKAALENANFLKFFF